MILLKMSVRKTIKKTILQKIYLFMRWIANCVTEHSANGKKAGTIDDRREYETSKNGYEENSATLNFLQKKRKNERPNVK